jgi:hypothetical protein
MHLHQRQAHSHTAHPSALCCVHARPRPAARLRCRRPLLRRAARAAARTRAAPPSRAAAQTAPRTPRAPRCRPAGAAAAGPAASQAGLHQAQGAWHGVCMLCRTVCQSCQALQGAHNHPLSAPASTHYTKCAPPLFRQTHLRWCSVPAAGPWAPPPSRQSRARSRRAARP